MKTSYIVYLEHIPSKLCTAICSCKTEWIANQAGKALIHYYNNPQYGYEEWGAGITINICYNPEYTYYVKEHVGEWIGR